jgi:aminopeptidase N
MKLFYRNIFLVILIIYTSRAFCQFIPDNSNTRNIAMSEKKAYQSKSPKSPVSIGSNYDVKYHRFKLYIDPDTLYIKGSVTTYFKTTKDTVSEINFELTLALTVDSVTNHNSKLSFSHSSKDEIKIELGNKLALNTLDSITIYYKGIPPKDTMGFGSFSRTMHGDNYDIPNIWTLSEPYGAKDWWPCKQSLNDKIDSIDMYVTTPKKYRAAGNGLLVNESLNGNNKTYHWKHRYPIAAYLIAVSVTDYSVYSDWVNLPGNKKLEVLNYVYPEDAELVKPMTAMTPGFIQLYDRLFIPYPFMQEKYGHAEFGWGGGMEHQTMTFISSNAFNFEVISHELAHQWFGDMITMGSWHDIWLNEGFATYLTGLCYENLDPTHHWWNIWKKKKIADITRLPDGSVYVADTANNSRLFDSRLTYNKGAMFLHTIRWVIGDSNFYHALRSYLKDPDLAYGYAQNPDLKTHFEAESLMDLTQLFNDWYYGQGYPTYGINAIQTSNDSLMLTLSQTTSDPSVSFFALPVPIKFKNNEKDTLIVFNNTFSDQTFKTHLSFKADSAIFDPDRWLIAHSASVIVNVSKEISPDRMLVINPNPANDKCFINSIGLKVIKTELLNTTGNILDAEMWKPEAGIDLKNLSSGFYFIRIYTDKGIITKKLIKI